MPRNPKQDANLEKFTSEQSREEAAKNGRKGGIASGKARREKNAIKRAMESLMEMPVNGKVKDMMKGLGYSDDDMTCGGAVVATLWSKAILGDMKALEMLMNYFFQASEDERKTKESNARIEALATKGVDITVESGDGDDGGVVIYLPEIEKEGSDESKSEDQ